MPQRTPDQIRASIEANRAELAVSLERLRGEVAEVTDWRKQIREHQQEVLIGAAVAGFVLGGGIAAIGGLLRRKRKRAWSPSSRAVRSAASVGGRVRTRANERPVRTSRCIVGVGVLAASALYLVYLLRKPIGWVLTA